MDITKPLNAVDVALLKPKFHEALDFLYSYLESQVNDQFKAYCITFEYPRKVYTNSREWHTLNMAAYSHFLLSAGESGEDENGKYQVFSLDTAGCKLLGWDT